MKKWTLNTRPGAVLTNFSESWAKAAFPGSHQSLPKHWDQPTFHPTTSITFPPSYLRTRKEPGMHLQLMTGLSEKPCSAEEAVRQILTEIRQALLRFRHAAFPQEGTAIQLGLQRHRRVSNCATEGASKYLTIEGSRLEWETRSHFIQIGTRLTHINSYLL